MTVERRFVARANLGMAVAVGTLVALILGLHAATGGRADAEGRIRPRRLNVVGTLPLPGDLLTDRIVLFFDDNIVLPEDGPSTEPFTIEPAVRGKFQIEPNFVVFEPEWVSQDTLYTIHLNKAIRSVRGQTLNPGHRTLTFVPFKFEPKQVWLVEDTPDQIAIGIRFPVAVEMETLKEYLSVIQPSGTAVPYDLIESTPGKIFRIVIKNEINWPLQIRVAKGLPDSESRIQMDSDFSSEFGARPPLRVTGLRWFRYNSKSQILSISFSNPVGTVPLVDHTTIIDESKGTTIPFSLAVIGVSNEWKMTIHLEESTSATVTVNIRKGMPAPDTTGLETAYSGRLTHQPDPLLIQRSAWENRGPSGVVLLLAFNQTLNPMALKEHLHFEPSIGDIRVESSWGAQYYVYGDWTANQSYRMRVSAGMPLPDGFKVARDIERTVLTQKLPTYFQFDFQGKYYFLKSSQTPPRLKNRGFERAQISLHRMFPSNIAVAVREIYQGQASYGFDQRWAEDLATTTIDLRRDPNKILTTDIPIARLFPPQKRGVFFLQARSEPGGYDIRKIVLLTDIGLLAHWQNDELVVFAHDLYSLEPRSLAKVTVYSSKNQILGRANTDNHGIAHLKNFNTALGTPNVLVVEHGDDYTFLELDERRDQTNTFGSIPDGYNPGGYDAFIYADRDLYRPGEVVHLRWIVRKQLGDALAGVPLLARVKKPNDKDLISTPTLLSEFGTGELELVTQKAYPTGLYTASIEVPGSDRPIGTYQFHVEEFVPNRIKATTSVDGGNWVAGKPYSIKVNAQHLFGAPVEDRKCEAKVTLQRQALTTKKWADYHFGNDSTYEPTPVALGQQKTDKEGNAEFTFEYEAPAQLTFPVKAIVTGRVFELGGRPVTSNAEVNLLPSDTCLGIALAPSTEPKKIKVLAAAISADESPADLAQVTITLERQVWNYYVRRYYSYHSPNWSESFETIESKQVDLNGGKGSTEFSIDQSGRYRLRISADSQKQFSTLSFYNYWGRQQIVSGEQPDLIRVRLDRDVYEIGEEAEIRVESPFDGKGIIVIQNAGIQRMLPIDVKDGIGRVSVPITAAEFPNVWAEATVIHAIHEGERQVYPFSSFAAANIRVRDRRRELTVTFPGLPEETRPARKTSFEIEVHDTQGKPVEAELTLAAVDEGIHLITNYQNPDPISYFGRPRRPLYQRAHYYDKIAYDFEKPEAGGGRGAGMNFAKRVGANDDNWIRPVALWSSVVRTDAQGRSRVEMELPEFDGQLRLVAVATTADASGANGDHIFVRRPYMLRTNKPRFLLPGDTFKSKAILFNQTDAPCRARLSWSFGGVLRDNEGSREIEVPARGEGTVTAEFAAGRRIGQGNIRWDAVILDVAGNEVDKVGENIPIPVRPPAAFQSDHELVVLAPGETRTFRNTLFLDDERAEIEVVVGGNPQLRLQKALRYVVGYPYGCVEQTTSRLLPMYLFRRSKSLNGAMLAEDTNVNVYIQAGIDRLMSMQTSSGGLGYWPGARDPYPYGSIYALHFLTLVKNDREYALPTESINALEKYVRGIAMDWRSASMSSLYNRAYAVYVLSLGGDLAAIEQIPRFDAVTLPRSARYLLAAALAMNTKDQERIRMYLATAPTREYLVRERAGTLNSDIRNTAVELLALVQINDDPKQLHERADKLTAFIEDRSYGTTQENAFVITALSSYLSVLEVDAQGTSATIAGPKGEASISGMETYRGEHHGQGGKFTVANKGKANLFVNVTTRGVPENPEVDAVENKGIVVQRSFHSSEGETLEGDRFPQAASFVVRLDIRCNRNVENLVVADLLPAGFEVENPRLNPSALPAAEFKGAMTPSFLEVRDDRMVLAFNSLLRGNHKFFYVVNAVTPGKFKYPPVEAECMYDAAIMGRSLGGEIEVLADE